MNQTQFYKAKPNDTIRFLPPAKESDSFLYQYHHFHPQKIETLPPCTQTTEIIQVPIYDQTTMETKMWNVRKDLYDRIQNNSFWDIMSAIRSTRPSYFGLYDTFRDWVLEACERVAP